MISIGLGRGLQLHVLCRWLSGVALASFCVACGPSLAGDDGGAQPTGSSAGSSEPTGAGSGEATTSGAASSASPSGGTMDSSDPSGGEEIPPCGCAVLNEFGEQTYPGCAEIDAPCDTVTLERCDSDSFDEDECVATGTLEDNAAFTCLLEALRDATPGEHVMVADGSGYFGFRRRLRINEDGSGVAFHCSWLDIGSSCDSVTVGTVDLVERATTCLMISADVSRVQCAWDLFVLPDPPVCDAR